MRGRTVKSPERVAEAQRMRADGYPLKVIAQCFGISKTAVHTWINDPDGAKQRQRFDSYRGTCLDCGAPTTGHRGRSKAPKHCARCSQRRIVASGARADMVRAHERAERIVAWWAEGLTLREIADELGWTMNHISMEFDRLRKKGYDLPYRRSAEHVEAIRAGIAARKAAA